MPNHDRFECQTAIDSDAILQAVLDNSIMVKYFKDEKPTYARMTAHLPNKDESYECLTKVQHELLRSEEK
ncbi:hypothetical protein HO192_12050 [Escherichia coli]|nr:hypothetical protein [Escherichia coli]